MDSPKRYVEVGNPTKTIKDSDKFNIIQPFPGFLWDRNQGIYHHLPIFQVRSTWGDRRSIQLAAMEHSFRPWIIMGKKK
jgi:hypothetical protein